MKMLACRISRTLSQALVFGLAVLGAHSSPANPQGLTVVSGTAQTQQRGNTLQITTSQDATLQWNNFNIAPGELTIFREPSANSVVFNQVVGGNLSSIYGSLRANGIVVLENQNGFYFGPNAVVKANGLVVTTAATSPWANAGGAGWSFDGPPPAASIINYGHLETASGGSLYLIGSDIENHGTISAPGGTATLIAGQTVMLSDGPTGLGLSIPVQLPVGSVNNQGQITADAGQVLLQAQTVNNSGVVQANSVREKNGVIEFYASDAVQLGDTSVIQANGDSTGDSSGGSVVVKSGGTFQDSAGSVISARGGADGGNGGNVEVSAPQILSLDSRIDASAQRGWNEGNFSLDPENIVLGNFTSGSTSAGTSGVINATGSSGTVDVDVGSAFQNIAANILLEASGNITLNPGTSWDLTASTGQTSGQLTLEAGGNILFGAPNHVGASLVDMDAWSVTLEAGYNFAAGQGVVSGVGNVIFYGQSSINTATGNINILTGNSVTVQSGGVVSGMDYNGPMSGGGGNVTVQAVSGNVITGSSTAGYDFTTSGSGYVVDPGLGGISTAGGGNVTITAGGSITGSLPGGNARTQTDSGSGAFGSSPGNVTLTAGGNVTGHYVVTDGVGVINALNAGTSPQNLALSLVNGSWTVNATDSVYLQEVRNPNGMFNNVLASEGVNPDRYLYDYSLSASVTLDAGDGVFITGSAPPRDTGANQPLIFPPSLTIQAGAGGITLDTGVNLFPSPLGGLNLTTTGGGSLICPVTATLNISDSTRQTWHSASSFTAADPSFDELLHLEDPNPTQINISGSISDFTLYSPKALDMKVGGNLVDSSLWVENLHPTDATSITVGGEILDHSDYVFLTVPTGETPNLAALDQVAEPDIIGPDLNTIPNPNLIPALENIENQITFDAATGSLSFAGRMSLGQEQALENIHFLDNASLQNLYQQSQMESTAPIAGLNFAGPGLVKINAATMDLGNSGGIISYGIGGGYQDLAPLTSRGADLDISTTGDLSMLASTIESQYGGAINIACGGALDVGSVVVQSTRLGVVGIVSLWGGNINIVSEGDVDVDGSRIAAYDGGNIFVESLEGSVNAGTGGQGNVLVAKPFINAQGNVAQLYELIPGSGIMATSFPELTSGETAQIGDITVETPNGNIVANKGGIEQLTLSPVADNHATVTLIAGSRDTDGSVITVGDVDAIGSGVIGGEVNISATGNINGVVVASIGASISALQNVNATVLSQGSATVSAGGSVTGTIAVGGGATVSGGSVNALVVSVGPSSVSGASGTGGGPTAAAGSPSNSSAGNTMTANQENQPSPDLAANDDPNDPRRKPKNVRVKEYVGRVTVILPN